LYSCHRIPELKNQVIKSERRSEPSDIKQDLTSACRIPVPYNCMFEISAEKISKDFVSTDKT